MKLVAQITANDKVEFIRLIRRGLDPGEAARKLGSTGTQFRKLRSPLSASYDQSFAVEVEKAKRSKAHKRRRLRRIGR